ncbi:MULTISPECIES: ribosome maturation factor RimP [Jonquetella]|uniref:Ribosome maturation factor RimP n=1 Tax=Jonquetella anthropi DSM 22815 TaxID=885272 RepID=H0UJS9_9BACT|nr:MULTISPECIES: ribosome maturation factor RimP [Jonquetella]EEX48631.1 hypothetical protein GCWU000246_00656 [Jonquetella anthropi E3_33 E1]EHM12938.1 hypothetical protein JonanDRAFT_0534 [Jonquetella anthropi DSM 22815]ERL23525.1 hypothetical protein HMPREF1249_0526 [Jonquetella sp. BV3C21]
MGSSFPALRGELTALLKPVVVELGYRWEGLQLEEIGSMTVRVFIDGPNGVTADDCEVVSKAIDPLLEGAMADSNRYYLEVSSPGLERFLFELDDYRRFIGETARIRFHGEGSHIKRLTGVVEAVDEEGRVTIHTEEETAAIPFEDIVEGSLVYKPQKGEKKTFKRSAGKGGSR